MIAIEVAAPAKAGRLPSQMARGSMAQAMGYPVVIMLLTNTLATWDFETRDARSPSGLKVASLDENCGSFARIWTTSAAAQKTIAEKPPALRKGCLSGSRPQLLMAWTAVEEQALRDAVEQQPGGAPKSVGPSEARQSNCNRQSRFDSSTAECVAVAWAPRSAVGAAGTADPVVGP